MNRTVRSLRPFGTTIFAHMSELATRHGAIDLGQGSPDEDGPSVLLDAAIDAIRAGHNQYPPGLGVADLRAAIAAERERRYGIHYDPASEVLVTVGATEGIAATVLGLVEPGDEVVIIEPYFDTYVSAVALAGGVARFVSLRLVDGEWALDMDALHRALTPRTKLLMLNTPHNPTGTVLAREELEEIARLCIAADIAVMSDEVYEHLVFDGRTHVPIAGLPGMRDRTVTLSSAAKLYNVTGWKTGWALAPARFIDALRAAKQVFTYAGATPLQHAVARALTFEPTWPDRLALDMAARRDMLVDGLRAVGFRTLPTHGTYFVVVDATGVGFADGRELCEWMPGHVGVAAIPLSAFCADPEGWSRPFVRFSFCKARGTLVEGIDRLRALRAC